MLTKIPYHPNSESLFNSLKDLPFACWLDSGKPNSNYGRYDIISALPSLRLETLGADTKIYQRDAASFEDSLLGTYQSDPLTLLKAEIDKLGSASVGDTSIPFSGGAIGYFGYDLTKHYAPQSKSQKSAKPKSALPDMHVGIYQWAIVQDHQSKTAYLTQLPSCHPDLIQAITKRLKQNANVPALKPLKVSKLSPSISQKQYLQQLEKINQYILAGDCYQVNFAQCFSGSYTGDPYAAYGELRKTMASPFSAYLSLGDKQVIMSLSPERFIKTHGNSVLTQPIKGTAARNKLTELDKQAAADLQASEKNRAENLMIVDLLRNDLGQHCVPGSIKVDTLFGLQSFPNVHHLVSDIVGTLRNGADSIDLLRDCFPGGSITGAPKKRAMEIIEELENRSRGVYCGSIGYINHNGDMDTNIAIRTISCDGDTLYCWGGGGIVADSTAAEEYQESLDKINAILKILGKNT